MKTTLRILALGAVCAVGLAAAALATANPEEACKKWPNNKQCTTTTTVPTDPTTTDEEPPPTTTDEEPPTETDTTPGTPPPPSGGGTTGGTTSTPTSDLPLTGAPAFALLAVGLGLLASGLLLLHRRQREN